MDPFTAGRGVHCKSNAGNKGIRINRDYRAANDRFKIYVIGKGSHVCAQRLDRRSGWGMRLRIKCRKPKIKFITKYEKMKVHIGRSGGNKRCASVRGKTYAYAKCSHEAGDKHKRINKDHWNANDRFHISIHGRKHNVICARRLDSKGGWGMNLQIMCKRPVYRPRHVYFGASRSNTRCANSGYWGIKCKLNSGDKYKIINRDHRHANDRFHIRVSGKTVCAKRVDSRGGWGMKLQIKCKSPQRPVPAPRPKRPPRRYTDILIGSSRSNNKCVKTPYYGIWVHPWMGNRGKRLNRDHWHANDRFRVYSSPPSWICATRKDSHGGWGMKLKVRCIRPSMRWRDIYIGNSGSKRKCVKVKNPKYRIWCFTNAGNRYIRKNRDHWHANDRFHMDGSSRPGNEVCANRKDKRHGWGMKLKVRCQEVFEPGFEFLVTRRRRR